MQRRSSRTKAPYSNAMRMRSVGRSNLTARPTPPALVVVGRRDQRRVDPVARADHRLDDRRLAELAPQRHHRHPDGGRERVGVLVPDPVEQLLAADHGARAISSVSSTPNSLRVRSTSSPARVTVRLAGVQLEVAGRAAPAARPGWCAGRAPAPGPPVRRTRTAWPGSRRRPAPGPATLSSMVPLAVSMITRVSTPSSVSGRQISSPRHAGQVAVEHDHVVAGQRRLAIALVAVVGDVDGHALAAQATGHRLRQLDFVLHHKDSHAVIRLRDPVV